MCSKYFALKRLLRGYCVYKKTFPTVVTISKSCSWSSDNKRDNSSEPFLEDWQWSLSHFILMNIFKINFLKIIPQNYFSKLFNETTSQVYRTRARSNKNGCLTPSIQVHYSYTCNITVLCLQYYFQSLKYFLQHCLTYL